ncbi:gamma-glutamyltransferase [Corynebacterium sp.]|uniref:gamma-glutamyltransferase n=1 Tax=Corynebacterium sp. TaxID=1720 RepID=UPI0026498A79|nr:gamma-glutamyltransferase [Corynebacterium sp.]MDN5718693.1 gamma-glutamyltransferase [Corynebacterium sp.]
MGLSRRAAGATVGTVSVLAMVTGCSTPEPEPLPTASPDACLDGGLEARGASRGGMVSTPDPDAPRAACSGRAEGGTAADAVVAAQYVLGLPEPNYSGPGGGGLVIYHDAQTGETASFDGTVYAPQDDASDDAVGVPQTDRLMDSLRRAHGVKSLAELTEPARRLASDGFVVTERLAAAMDARNGIFEELPAAGDVLTNPDYAEYLMELEPTEEPIEPSDPLCVDYQGHSVCGSHSTATGMMVVAEALGILDRLDLARLTPVAGTARATAQHLVMEAERIAFTDANTWMGDGTEGYVDQIVTDDGHLDDAADSIRQKTTLSGLEPQDLDGLTGEYEDSDDQGTSQVTVRDSAGSMATLTTTLQRSFGSGKQENGYFLNNSLDNFSADADPGDPNYREPGAHPRTMMSPVLVFDGDEPVMALGSPGGRKIPSYVVKALVAMVDWNLRPVDAVDMPNFGATNRNSVYAARGGAEQKKMRGLLEEWGHDLEAGRFDSGLSVIRLRDDQVDGAADHRRDGSVAGVDLG